MCSVRVHALRATSGALDIAHPLTSITASPDSMATRCDGGSVGRCSTRTSSAASRLRAVRKPPQCSGAQATCTGSMRSAAPRACVCVCVCVVYVCVRRVWIRSPALPTRPDASGVQPLFICMLHLACTACRPTLGSAWSRSCRVSCRLGDARARARPSRVSTRHVTPPPQPTATVCVTLSAAGQSPERA